LAWPISQSKIGHPKSKNGDLGSSKILIDQFDQKYLSESNPHLKFIFLERPYKAAFHEGEGLADEALVMEKIPG